MPRLVPVLRSSWLQCAGRVVKGRYVVRYEGREGTGETFIEAAIDAGWRPY